MTGRCYDFGFPPRAVLQIDSRLWICWQYSLPGGGSI
jgi:hypothetical protein